MYGYPGMNNPYGLEGPYKRRRAKRVRSAVLSLVIGCALSGAAFFLGAL